MKKRQTTLPAYDKKQIRRNLRKKNSNVFIASKEGNKRTPRKELTKLSDALLKDLTELNKNLRMNGKEEFIITSAIGNAEWELEPSFMLTNVSENVMPRIFALAKKYKQDSIAVSNKNETGASFVTPEGEVTDKYKKMVFDANALYSTDFPTGQRLTFKKQGPRVLDQVFSYQGMQNQWNSDNPEEEYVRNIPSWYELDKWLIRVDSNNKVIATIGWKEYDTYLVLGGLRSIQKKKIPSGNADALYDARDAKLPNKPKVMGFRPKGNIATWIDRYRGKGFTVQKDVDENNKVINLVPENIQEEFESRYKGNWAVKKWFDMLRKTNPDAVLKARSKSDMIWIRFGNSLLQDEIPFKPPEKYVKYSNLGRDNKRAIKFYLETGLAKPKRRNKFYSNIQEEMLRGSNVRYDVEDQSRGDK